MNLDFLLEELGNRKSVRNAEVTSVTEKAENVKEGSLFVAVKGKDHNGNDYVAEALKKGAVAVISESDCSYEEVIKVKDARLALSFLCSAFYSHPQDKMKVIGITGTDGKTTTAEYLRHILQYAGRRCAVIGTLGVGTESNYRDTGYTTPCAETLFSEMRHLCDDGYEYCILEVSSQALAQKRVAPIVFDLGIITNIGTDHLDYHGSVEKYAAEKAKLFRQSKKALINADDAYSHLFESAAAGKAYLYSAKDKFADYMAKNIRFTDNGISYIILNSSNVARVKADTVTDYSVYNTLVAIAAADILGVEPSVSCKAVESLPQVKGRLERITGNGFDVYIDFAHTPEALGGVLRNLRRICNRELICVFGCGGDRDKCKRSEMGTVAAELADAIILTSDNPRSEKAEDIISDIIKGINNKADVYIQPDREKAISLALNKASDGDIVLVAGKGHEQYQCIGKEKKFFSDELTVKRILGVD